MDFYTENVKLRNMNTIRAFSAEFFSVLSETFLQSPHDNGGCLQV